MVRIATEAVATIESVGAAATTIVIDARTTEETETTVTTGGTVGDGTDTTEIKTTTTTITTIIVVIIAIGIKAIKTDETIISTSLMRDLTKIKSTRTRTTGFITRTTPSSSVRRSN